MLHRWGHFNRVTCGFGVCAPWVHVSTNPSCVQRLPMSENDNVHLEQLVDVMQPTITQDLVLLIAKVSVLSALSGQKEIMHNSRCSRVCLCFVVQFGLVHGDPRCVHISECEPCRL